MPSSSTSTQLTDPVCGKAVGSGSTYRHVHSGALYCFCSETCRARFALHPTRLAFIAMSGGLGPPAQGLDPAPPAAAAPSAVPPGDQPGRADTGGAFGFLQAWRERRYANLCCRELLQLYRTIAARHPDLAGDMLYRQVVAARIGSDLGAAEAVIRHATQSYAIWPVERALTFRDVVHYLAVSEFVDSHRGTHWVHTGLKRIVDASIPHKL